MWLAAAGGLLLAVVAARLPASDGKGQAEATRPRCRLPLLDNDAAWQHLPNVEGEVADRRLPIWARALAGPLPHTTAVLLELDYQYRTSEAFDPRLRAAMRWTAARANLCSYGQRYAEVDLLRAGMTRDQVDHFESYLASLGPHDRAAIRFAEQLSRSASSVTDEEVRELVAAFGEQPVVAMVLQMAYANFQDRLLLTLDVGVEAGGPLPPLAVRFVRPAAGESIAAQRPEPVREKSIPPPRLDLGGDWTSVHFDQLLAGMQLQRERAGRVSVPKWEDVYPQLPAGLYPPDRPSRVRWSLVVLGHQPQLGSAWMTCLRTFGREAKQDRVFEETLFWVITRTIDCFY
jgi:alkylhydroperoxidase family enzyme